MPARACLIALALLATLTLGAPAQLSIGGPSPLPASDARRPVPMSDLDGDGLRDFAQMTTVGLQCFSSRDFSPIGAPITSHVPSAFAWGTRYDGGHDLDGDGVSDLVVSAPGSATTSCNASPSDARVFVYSGATRLLMQSWAPNTSPANYYGAEIEMIGDLDGDGLGEVLVATSPCFSSQQFVDVRSGATGAIIRTYGIRPNTRLAEMGDIDGDQRADYAISDLGFSTFNRGRIRVYSGASGTQLYEILGGIGDVIADISIRGIDDIDGDGIKDLAFNGLGAIRVASGATGTIIRDRTTTPGNYLLGWEISALGDVNGDGVPDYRCMNGDGITVEAITISGATGTIIARESGPNARGFTRALDLGDVNGDGLDDHVAQWQIRTLTGRTRYSDPGLVTPLNLDWVSAAAGTTSGAARLTGASPFQAAFLAFGFQTQDIPVPDPALHVLVEPTFLLPIACDAAGSWAVPIDLSALLPLAPLHAQVLTLTTTGLPEATSNRLSLIFSGT